MVWSFLKYRDWSIERFKELKMSLLRLIPHFVQMRHICSYKAAITTDLDQQLKTTGFVWMFVKIRSHHQLYSVNVCCTDSFSQGRHNDRLGPAVGAADAGVEPWHVIALWTASSHCGRHPHSARQNDSGTPHQSWSIISYSRWLLIWAGHPVDFGCMLA